VGNLNTRAVDLSSVRRLALVATAGKKYLKFITIYEAPV
jgi:hypothetical protein